MKHTNAQRQAAGHAGSHALVLAGPGTGKTATLVERCRLLVRNGVPLDSIFVTTFTQKAALEIKDRLKPALMDFDTKGQDYDAILEGAFIGTFHSLCARFLKRFPTDIGLPYDFRLIAEEEQRRILAELGVEWDEEEGSVIDMISSWKDRKITPEEALKHAQALGDNFTIQAAFGFAKYDEYTKSNDLIDFSDMILNATKILKSGGAGQKWFAKRFQHFIIDEFQDTNACQIEFLQAAAGRYGTVWAVGDEDQSLYEWRGSSPQFCIDFQKYFPNAKLFQLTESFRCSPLIIQMAAKVIGHNRHRYSKTLRPARAGKAHEFVMYKAFADEQEEAKWIGNQIAKQISQGGNPDDIAVLFRTSSIANAIQQQLEARDVPFKVSGISSFWELPEVKLFTKSVASIAKDPRFGGKDSFGKTKAGFKCRSFSEEFVGEDISVFAHPLSRILYEYRPLSYDRERRGAWMSNVEAVLSILLQKADVGEFLDMVVEREAGQDRSAGKGVSLSTLHASKGLEWNTVFLAGAEGDVLPHFKSKNIEEERRLYYVGMTRARHHLIVSYARSRFSRSKEPSQFLRESLLRKSLMTGKFVWLDPELKKQSKPAEAKESKQADRKAARKGLTFRHKGGRSLIPPEERGK